MNVCSPGLPHIPWEPCPSGGRSVFWRSSHKSIIGHRGTLEPTRVYKSSVVPFGNGFAGVFRVDVINVEMRIYFGFSTDGFDWDIKPMTVVFDHDRTIQDQFVYGFDPRIAEIDGRYYITWCDRFEEPSVHVAWTEDFVIFHQREGVFIASENNGILFPRRINEQFGFLSCTNGSRHWLRDDILYCESEDLETWGSRNSLTHAVMQTIDWQSSEFIPGPAPIETEVGWLVLYSTAIASQYGHIYSMGGALLDLITPWKIVARSNHLGADSFGMGGCFNATAGSIYPSSVLVDGDSGRLTVYYGGDNGASCIAFAYVSEIIDFIKTHPE